LVCMMFELVIAAATIVETVDRIVSSCCVVMKADLLERESKACRVIGIVGIAAVRVGTVGSTAEAVRCVRIAFWAVGIRKIHWAASNIVSIECRRVGEC